MLAAAVGPYRIHRVICMRPHVAITEAVKEEGTNTKAKRKKKQDEVQDKDKEAHDDNSSTVVDVIASKRLRPDPRDYDSLSKQSANSDNSQPPAAAASHNTTTLEHTPLSSHSNQRHVCLKYLDPHQFSAEAGVNAVSDAIKDEAIVYHRLMQQQLDQSIGGGGGRETTTTTTARAAGDSSAAASAKVSILTLKEVLHGVPVTRSHSCSTANSTTKHNQRHHHTHTAAQRNHEIRGSCNTWNMPTTPMHSNTKTNPVSPHNNNNNNTLYTDALVLELCALDLEGLLTQRDNNRCIDAAVAAMETAASDRANSNDVACCAPRREQKPECITAVLDERTARYFFARLCEALLYCHKCGIVHCDVTPKQVLFTRDGSLRLADFALARVVDGAEENVQLPLWHAGGGLPRLLAPEVAQFRAQCVTADTGAAGLEDDERADDSPDESEHRRTRDGTPAPSASSPSKQQRAINGEINAAGCGAHHAASVVDAATDVSSTSTTAAREASASIYRSSSASLSSHSTEWRKRSSDDVAIADPGMTTFEKLTKVDVWGAGCVLFFMVMGHDPFGAPDARDCPQRQHLLKGARHAFFEGALRKRRRVLERSGHIRACTDVSAACKDLMWACLEPRVEDRWSMCDVFAHPWVQAATVGRRATLRQEEEAAVARAIRERGR